MTAAEFTALPDDSEFKRELIDGELCEVSNGEPVHETVKGNVILELAAFVESQQIKFAFRARLAVI